MSYIRLNVGGTKYTTLVETLTSPQHGEHMLALMFRGLIEDGTGAFSLERDSTGAYFVDRDGPTFRYVLAYLRHSGGAIPLPHDPAQRELLVHEADALLLPTLAQACRFPVRANSLVTIMQPEFTRLVNSTPAETPAASAH